MATIEREISKDLSQGYGAALHDQLEADPTLAASDYKGINIAGDVITGHFETEPSQASIDAFDAVLTAHRAEEPAKRGMVLEAADGKRIELTGVVAGVPQWTELT